MVGTEASNYDAAWPTEKETFMRARITRVAVVLLAALFLACNVGVEAMRSGTIHDDNVEEPLSKPAKKYEPALRTSNDLVAKLIAREYHSIYESDVEPSLKAQISEANLVAMIAQIESQLGPMKRYKPMQWGFSFGEERGVKFVVSTKIVQHEKGELNYNFVFAADGPYRKLVGIHTRARNKSRAANDGSVPSPSNSAVAADLTRGSTPVSAGTLAG